MDTYIRKVNYYETDKMGITHHSNYIRWMEESRMALLAHLGCDVRIFEAAGFTSPVVSVECRYQHPTTFGDEVRIETTLAQYTGARFEVHYTMTDCATGATVCTAKTTHCFIDSNGRPIAIKNHFPEFDAIFKNAVSLP